MKLLFLGDVHGEWAKMDTVIKAARMRHPETARIFQVGDLGEGFQNVPKYKPTHGFKVPPIIAIDGNHEHFDRLEANNGWDNENLEYLARGQTITVEDRKILGFGGAWSIDKHRRTQGIDWFPQEEPTQAEFWKFVGNGVFDQDIVITHDFPSQFQIRQKFPDIVGHTGTRVLLQEIWELVKPKFWFFGHYHDFAMGEYNGTQWVCCPIIDDFQYVVLDLEANKIIVETV